MSRYRISIPLDGCDERIDFAQYIRLIRPKDIMCRAGNLHYMHLWSLGLEVFLLHSLLRQIFRLNVGAVVPRGRRIGKNRQGWAFDLCVSPFTTLDRIKHRK